jgi:PAS domain S-box-containing protein
MDFSAAVPGCSQKFCRILSTFSFGVMILGEEGNILYAGPWLSDITGLKKDQLATLEQFEAQLRLPLEGDSRQALLEGKPTTAMVELQTREGFRRLYLQSFDDPRGCVILLIPNAVRAEAEELPPWDILEDHTVNLYRTVIETMKEGIVLQTSNGAIVEANRAAAEILGVSMDQLMGRTSMDPQWSTVNESGDPIAGEDHPAMVVLRTGQPVHDFVMGVNRPSGEWGWILINSQPMKDDQGEIILAVTTFTDITNRLDNQKDLEKKTLEAQAASQAKSAFLANISHEIRTPLNAVLGFSQLLQNSLTDPLQKEYLQSIREGAESLLALIDDVLDISKLEVGKIKLVNEPVDLVTLIQESKEIFDWKLKSQDTDVLWEIQDGLDRIFLLDEGRMRQVLVNIIGNAVKFTPKGEIRLILQGQQKGRAWDLTIKVQDSGTGIRQEDLERIFEAFHQVNPSVYEKNEGTGLGLSLTKGIVGLMGGEILLESEFGQGTLVTIKLPEVYEAPEEDGQDADLDPVRQKLSGRVLVVDDVSSNRLIVKGLLREYQAVVVEEAKDGQEGVDKILSGRFDLVFLDIKMPKLGGGQVVRLVRDHPEFAQLPIYALTASTGKDSVSEDFTGFLGKPMDFDDFFKIVTQHLSQGPEEVPTPTLDTAELPQETIPRDLVLEVWAYLKSNLQKTIKSGDFEKVKEFAQALLKLVEGASWTSLEAYCQQILLANGSFDIKKIRELLENFPRWIERWRHE